MEQKKEMSDLLYNNKKSKTVPSEVCEAEKVTLPISVPIETSVSSVVSSVTSVAAVPQPQLEINMLKITINPVINL